MLLEMEVDSDIKKKLAQDALFTAAMSGREDVLHLLLTYNIDINERYGSNPSLTALEVARRCGHDNIVQILLDNGAQDEGNEGEQPPTATPAIPVTPENSDFLASFEDNTTSPNDIITGIASDPINQLFPQQQLPSTMMPELSGPDPSADVFDFEQFLHTDGDFNFDPSVTFKNPEGNGVPASTLPAAQDHAQAQAQAQAEAQQQTSQQEKQQQQSASQHQSAQEIARQQRAQMQFAFQHTLPAMAVQTDVPPISEQKHHQQQEAAQQQRPQRDSESDLLLNSDWL